MVEVCTKVVDAKWSGLARWRTAPGSSQEGAAKWGDKGKNGVNKGALDISRLLGRQNCSAPWPPIIRTTPLAKCVMMCEGHMKDTCCVL